MKRLLKYLRFKQFTERVSFGLFLVFFFGLIGWAYGQIRYDQGNADGLKKAYRYEMFKKYPEYFQDWQIYGAEKREKRDKMNDKLEKLKEWIKSSIKFRARSLSRIKFLEGMDAYNVVLEQINRLQSKSEPEEFCEWEKIKNSYSSIEFIPLSHKKMLKKLYKRSIIQNIDIFPYCNICGRKIKEI